MKMVLRKLKENPKLVLAEHFVKISNLRYDYKVWYTLLTGCVWNVTSEPPVRMFEKITTKYLSEILHELESAFAKTTQPDLASFITLVGELLKSIREPRSAFVSVILQDNLTQRGVWNRINTAAATTALCKCRFHKAHLQAGGSGCQSPSVARLCLNISSDHPSFFVQQGWVPLELPFPGPLPSPIAVKVERVILG